MSMRKVSVGVAMLCLGLSGTAQAVLIDRGSGLIYDTVLDITWLQDANYAGTSGHAGSGVTSDGRMNWIAALAWADGLAYGGFDDWRLPTITDTGEPGYQYEYSGTDAGYNVDTSGSEMASLFYDTLGNLAFYSASGEGAQAGWGLTNTGPFSNLQTFTPYWSGAEYAPNTLAAWHFSFDSGQQFVTNQGTAYFAWAVRDGDVAAISVPEPGTLGLLGGALALFGLSRRRVPGTANRTSPTGQMR